MKKVRWHYVVLLFGFLMINSSQAVLPNQIVFDNGGSSILLPASNYGNYNPPESGDWTISENTQIVGLNAVLNGSIWITEPVTVKFINSEVSFGLEYGLWVSSNDVVIDGINITAGADEIFRIGSVNNVTIQNSVARGNGTNYDSAGVVGSGATNVTIVNSTFQNFYKSIFVDHFEDFVIEDSIFEQTPDSQALDGEMQFVDNTKNVRISNCIIRNLSYDGIEIYRSSDFMINNNTIIGIGAGLHFNNEPVSNIHIINNTFLDSGARINASDHLFFYNNDFQGDSLSMHNSRDTIISNNWFDYEDSLNAAREPSNTNITETNNHFRFTSDNGEGDGNGESDDYNETSEPFEIIGYPMLLLMFTIGVGIVLLKERFSKTKELWFKEDKNVVD